MLAQRWTVASPAPSPVPLPCCEPGSGLQQTPAVYWSRLKAQSRSRGSVREPHSASPCRPHPAPLHGLTSWRESCLRRGVSLGKCVSFCTSAWSYAGDFPKSLSVPGPGAHCRRLAARRLREAARPAALLLPSPGIAKGLQRSQRVSRNAHLRSALRLDV